MRIELKGNNDHTETKKSGRVAHRQRYFHFQHLSESRVIKEVIEREKQSVDAAQSDKPKTCSKV